MAYTITALDLFVWACVIGFVLWLVLRRPKPRDARAVASWSAGMPTELQQARLVASELRMETATPVRLRGATDQVYALADGRIVLVENKRSLHGSGLAAVSLQLGLCRLLLQHAPESPCRSARFADHAWIHITGPVAPDGRYIRVGLPTHDEVLAAYQRFLDVRRGAVPRARTVDPGLCQRVCPHLGARCSGSPSAHGRA